MKNSSLREHYRRLGVSSRANTSEINAAFRQRSKEVHPDTGGSVDDFEALQYSRRVLIDATREPEPVLSDRTDLAERPEDAAPRPIWMAGAFVGLPIAVGVGVTGLVTLDQRLALAGLLAGLAVAVVLTAALAVARVHRSNTATDRLYPPAEEVIELRDTRVRARQPG